jgi:putative membrane protein
MPLLLAILGNAIGLLLAVRFLPQLLGPDSIQWYGSGTQGFIELLLAGVVIGIINGIVKPIVKLLSLPLMLLTVGLFSIVINVGMLALADFFLENLEINGFGAYFATSIILAIVHVIL